MLMSMVSVLSVMRAFEEFNSLAPPKISSLAVGEEKEKVEELRGRLKDVFPENKYFQSERYLVRFLRARDLDVAETEKMYREMMEWRRFNKMDEVRKGKIPSSMMKKFYFESTGVDKEGCPILQIDFGGWDVRTFLEEDPANKDKFNNHSAAMWEIGELAVERAQSIDGNPPCNGWVIVADLSGFAYRTLASLQTVEAILEIVRIYEAYYPDGMKIVYVINAPWIFSLLLKLLKPVMGAGTIGKMNTYDTNKEVWQRVLFNEIERDQLYPRFGGTKKKLAKPYRPGSKYLPGSKS